MKKYLFICFIVISFYNANSQSLSLNEMFTICNKSNWSEVNEYLLRKGWDYYESSKGDNEHYNTITWALEKDYNNSAQGWFYLYTFEELPNKVRYSFSNKNTYNIIKTGITSSGMKQIESNIEDNAIQTKYANANYIVNITIEKRQRNDYDESSVTAYSVTVIKKSGVFDNDNGLKTFYDDNGNKEAEYYLKDGKINGIAKSFFPNGQIKVISNFINGNKSGISKEYDENGNQTYEFTYLNNELNGFYKVFENGMLSITGTLINGEKTGLFKVYDTEGRLDKEYEMKIGVLNGKYIEYYYSRDDNKLIAKEVGQYINDEKAGLWQLTKFNENGSTLLSSINYINGI
ncbi:MAG: hypothetical protein GYA51_03505, partial [Candidatus Methanofastidiosa archaeon]|nr:hypothetical protein [Candidatus Methanofastidiosa archaeon]